MTMIWVAVVLLVIGCCLLVTEMFIPGFGFFGLSGVALVIVSAMITAVTVPFGPFILLAELLAVGAVLYFAARYIKRKQLHGKLILDETVEAPEKDIGDLSYFLGKEGVSKTSLRPFGTVDFNGIAVDVCSDGDYISENRSVKVTAIKGNTVIVKQLGTNRTAC